MKRCPGGRVAEPIARERTGSDRYAPCPTCGKRSFVTKQGYVQVHNKGKMMTVLEGTSDEAVLELGKVSLRLSPFEPMMIYEKCRYCGFESDASLADKDRHRIDCVWVAAQVARHEELAEE